MGALPLVQRADDSIKDEGGRLERGPVRFDARARRLVAYQSHFARRRGTGPRGLVWVTVATGDRIGAGRTLKEAWSNLLGASVPALAGQAQATRLDEARRCCFGPTPRCVRRTGTRSDGPGTACAERSVCRGFGGAVSLLASEGRDYLRGLFARAGRVRTAVLALGGNALAQPGEPATVANQFRHARESMAMVVELARAGWRIVLVHGNGPQVGDELARNEAARRLVQPLPLGVLVAETAGWIGYMLQQSLQNALATARVSARSLPWSPRRWSTGTIRPRPSHQADRARADARPRWLGSARRVARWVATARGTGAGWRRARAPLAVVELPVVKRLLEQDTIVIAAGGGGPPVYEDPLLGLEGVDAVVDKDRVSAILAAQLGAEVLMILTNVEAVFEGWGTPAARPLRRLTCPRPMR